MINEDVLNIIKKEERYEDFVILENEIPFCEFCKNENYDSVQVHSTKTFKTKDQEQHIIGFCGVFSWYDNQVHSLDGDSYNPNMIVLGYEKFDYEEDETQKKGIDILVGNDW